MKSLLNFIIKYYYFILFVLIECFSIFLVVKYNNYHQASFLNSSSQLSGKVYKSFNSVSQYLSLKSTNDEMNIALASLANNSKNNLKDNPIKVINIHDSIFIQQYQFTPGKIINNSTNKQNNFITLNIGSNHGVEREMGVISTLGIVGIIKDVSPNYSSVISILNRNLRISAMIKKSGYFGSLFWDGKNFRYATMDDLPNHISVQKGDTIITSGYSTVFPKGKTIGVVDKINVSKRGDFMSLSILLSNDFKKISHVMVVKNLLKEEQLILEKQSSYD